VAGKEHRRRRTSRRQFVITSGMGIATAAINLPAVSAAAESMRPDFGHVEPPVTRLVQIEVNGRMHEVTVEIGTTLLDALRDHVGLTGTKKGCEIGACGACTVLVNGRRVNACLTLAVMAEGHAVTTIEAVAQGDKLHPLQQAFIAHDALQCGYCTPGQLISAIAYLNEGHTNAADPAVIREWMSGNICRCGAYPHIVAAIKELA
jgi:xanthine dehydrogenase YagT iron-sulfur-binding subunit